MGRRRITAWRRVVALVTCSGGLPQDPKSPPGKTAGAAAHPVRTSDELAVHNSLRVPVKKGSAIQSGARTNATAGSGGSPPTKRTSNAGVDSPGDSALIQAETRAGPPAVSSIELCTSGRKSAEAADTPECCALPPDTSFEAAACQRADDGDTLSAPPADTLAETACQRGGHNAALPATPLTSAAAAPAAALRATQLGIASTAARTPGTAALASAGSNSGKKPSQELEDGGERMPTGSGGGVERMATPGEPPARASIGSRGRKERTMTREELDEHIRVGMSTSSGPRYSIVEIAQCMTSFERSIQEEVERQHYAKMRPNAPLFLTMQTSDWATLNSSQPRRRAPPKWPANPPTDPAADATGAGGAS